MDVYGTAPVSDTGRYFRNNVWWWRPLWDYCSYVAPHLTAGVQGDTNDGDGLDKEGAEALSRFLLTSLSDGTCDEYEANRNREIAELPNEDCNLCDKTGIRTDNIGKEMNMDTKVLPEDKAIMLGRDTGCAMDATGWGGSLISPHITHSVKTM